MSKPAMNATPFKDVTDILIIGKLSVLAVFVLNDETVESKWMYREISTNTIVIEVGITSPSRFYCPNFGRGNCRTSLVGNCCLMYEIRVALRLKTDKLTIS